MSGIEPVNSENNVWRIQLMSLNPPFWGIENFKTIGVHRTVVS